MIIQCYKMILRDNTIVTLSSVTVNSSVYLLKFYTFLTRFIADEAQMTMGTNCKPLK